MNSCKTMKGTWMGDWRAANRNVHERASDVTDAFDAGAEDDEEGHRVTQRKDYEEADHGH